MLHALFLVSNSFPSFSIRSMSVPCMPGLKLWHMPLQLMQQAIPSPWQQPLFQMVFCLQVPALNLSSVGYKSPAKSPDRALQPTTVNNGSGTALVFSKAKKVSALQDVVSQVLPGLGLTAMRFMRAALFWVCRECTNSGIIRNLSNR